jgi:hypothetical protein
VLDAVIAGQITPRAGVHHCDLLGYLLGGVPAALVPTAGIFLPSSRRPSIGCPEHSRPMRTASTQLGCGMAPESC